MIHRTLLRHLIPAALLLAATRCGNLTQLAGAGVETTNGCMVGTLVRENGLPDSNALVKLFPAEYDPLTNNNTIPFTATDSAGRFKFIGIDTGTYTIVAAHTGLGIKAAVYKIMVAGDTVRLATATMRPPGTIQIRIPEQYDTVDGYFYIPGTGLIVSLKSASIGAVIIDSVPAGEIPGILYTIKSADVAPQVLVRSIIVPPAGKITIAFPQWAFNHRLTLNTTSSGAGISSNILNFPMLVRIDRNNFNFNEAGVDGNDLRFTKPDGLPLPYEIERWDPVSEVAEVWVRVDTVYGNASTQSIIMYWGNPNAAVGSNSATVFDTTNGFQGVWHLAEPVSAIATDATGNRYDGTGYYTSPVPGIIGDAQHFNGTSSIIRMKGTASSRLSFPMNGRYAVSAWVYHDTLADSVTYLVAGKGEHQYFIKNFDLGLSTGQHARQWEFTEYHDNDWQSATFVPANAKSWVYLVGVRDGSNEYLYVNGTLAMYKTFPQGQLPQDTSDDFAIGGFLRPVTRYNQGYAYFSGVIDEVTASGTPRSADWVKLSYMNQKEKDALVRW
jgi:hypothetical protein